MSTYCGWKKRRSLESILTLICLMLHIFLSTTNAVCGPRVRKPWGALNQTEKALYLSAVDLAIVRGYHALFVEIHTDESSGIEAHRTCGMIYWHRRYLLAYENMLRSLGPAYSCITIPYWDYFADYAKFINGDCTSMESCSPFLQDMGGSAGNQATVVVNNITTSGNCVNALPVSNFCESSAKNGTQCARCITRDSWSTMTFPSGFGYASIARLLSLSYGFSWFSQNIHYGIHNSIHSRLAGAMGTWAMPADPIFYNQHATIDLIHQLFYECQIGRPLTSLERLTNNYAFEQCSVSLLDICPLISNKITQKYRLWDNPIIQAESHPVLGQWFSPLPKEYWRYVSGTDLGEYSYSYQKDTLFSLLELSGLSCPKNKRRRRLQETTFTQTTKWDMRTRSVVKSFNLFRKVFNASVTRDASLTSSTLSSLNLMSTTAAPIATETPEEVTADTNAMVNAVDPITGEMRQDPDSILDSSKTDSMVDPSTLNNSQFDDLFDQVELMDCVYYHEKRGGVDDLTDTFRANMKLPPGSHTRCYNLVRAYYSGQKVIRFKEWKNAYKLYIEDAT